MSFQAWKTKLQNSITLQVFYDPYEPWRGEKAARTRRGKTTQQAKSLTKEEEEILWENGQLGNQTPRSLINTTWWLLTMHFGLRARQEHHDMMVEDFSIEKDEDGVEFITFSEAVQGSLQVKSRLATPTMFAKGEKRCPVALFYNIEGKITEC